jgi:hypothetical protein
VFEKALAVGVTKVLFDRVCNLDVVELDVLEKKAQCCKHSVTLSLGRPQVAAVSASAALPEDMGGRGDDPAKGSMDGGSTVMSEEKWRGQRVLEMLKE